MATLTKTIGQAGDYANIAAAVTAWVAGIAGASSGDHVAFELIDNAAYDETFSISSNPNGYASCTLRAASAVRNNGTPGSGARIAPTSDTADAVVWGVADCQFTVEWLEITPGSANTIARGITLNAAYNAGIQHHRIAHNIVHGNNSPAGVYVAGIGGGPNSAILARVIVENNLVYDWRSSSVAHSAYGIYVHGHVAPNVYQVFNNTVDGISNAGSGNAVGINANYSSSDTLCKNNVATNCTSPTGIKECFRNLSGSTASNNASDDATAPGASSNVNIVSGNTYNGAGDYRILNTSAAIYQTGADLGQPYAVDLLGLTRVAPWSIGAYQEAVGGSPPATITLTDPHPFKTKQATNGSAVFNVSGQYSGESIGVVQVQADGGEWSTLDDSPTGGTFSGTIQLATGTHVIAVRLSSYPGVTDSVADVLVGNAYLIIGQSNAAGRLTNFQSYSHPSQKSSMWKSGEWMDLEDPTETNGNKGSPWPLLASQLMADTGVPAIFLNYAKGGTTISEWWNETEQAHWIGAKAAVEASGVGGITAVLFDLGENDAVAGTPEATFRARLDGLASDVSATYGCKLIVAETGTVPGCDPNNMLAIRSAEMAAWVDNPNVQEGPMSSDRAGLHWETDAEGLTIAGRWYASITGNAPLPGIPDGEYNGAALLFTIVNGVITSIREAP